MRLQSLVYGTKVLAQPSQYLETRDTRAGEIDDDDIVTSKSYTEGCPAKQAKVGLNFDQSHRESDLKSQK